MEFSRLLREQKVFVINLSTQQNNTTFRDSSIVYNRDVVLFCNTDKILFELKLWMVENSQKSKQKFSNTKYIFQLDN